MEFSGGVKFLIFRSFFITIMTLGMMTSLTEFRFGVKKLLKILALYLVWAVAACAVLLRIGGEVLLLRSFLLAVSLPAIAISYWAAKDTPTQAVFNYMTQITFSLLGASVCRLLTYRCPLPDWINILLMCCFYVPVIFLEWRFLRRPFRQLVAVLPNRWATLTLIPCAFCFYLLFVASWPDNYFYNNVQMAYLYAGSIPLVLVYVAVFKSLFQQYQDQMEQRTAAIMAVQISALKEKLQKVQEVEDGIRIQRHDMRHQFQTVTELLTRGERQAALDFLDAAKKRLDEQKQVRWCGPPVLDAVFSSYFGQAKSQGIQVEAAIQLSGALPVDEGELAIVLANALENAIHANQALPLEHRKIRCRMVSTPSVMLELSNPCIEPVTFDDKGLPVARQDGHGLGVQSISTFCRKNGAVCQFMQADGWFRLRLVL